MRGDIGLNISPSSEVDIVLCIREHPPSGIGPMQEIVKLPFSFSLKCKVPASQSHFVSVAAVLPRNVRGLLHSLFISMACAGIHTEIAKNPQKTKVVNKRE